jgi:hypothetical protein
MLGAGLHKRSLELLVAAKIALERGCELTLRRAAFRRQARPEERVIPRLRGVVEDLRLAGVPAGRLDDVIQFLIGERSACDELVELLHVGRVMLAIMKAHRALRDRRLERPFVIGQRRKGKGLRLDHDVHRTNSAGSGWL